MRTGRTDLEIAVLRGLISRATQSASPAQRAKQFVRLFGAVAGYGWTEQEHRVVYECLGSAHGRQRAQLREEMAAEATRLGHPDVDWDTYFDPLSESDDQDLPEWIRWLKNNP